MISYKGWAGNIQLSLFFWGFFINDFIYLTSQLRYNAKTVFFIWGDYTNTYWPRTKFTQPQQPVTLALILYWPMVIYCYALTPPLLVHWGRSCHRFGEYSGAGTFSHLIWEQILYFDPILICNISRSSHLQNIQWAHFCHL